MLKDELETEKVEVKFLGTLLVEAAQDRRGMSEHDFSCRSAGAE
jgi:hypothetical protein